MKSDLLISAKSFMEIIKKGKVHGQLNNSTLQNSEFGWIMYGVPDSSLSSKLFTNTLVTFCFTTTISSILK